MKAGARLCPLLFAFGIASIVATASMAQSTEAPGTGTEGTQAGPIQPASEWPCEQPLRPEMSIGAMWQGPELDAQDDWREVSAVVTLVNQIAPRSVPQEEAVANIRRFAAGYQGAERSTVLTELFVGLFETLSAERNDIVRGIKRFHRRQDALARRIEEGWKALGEIDPNTTDPKIMERRAELQQQVDWDSRIFDDRQRLLPAVCEQPRVLEQRVFALARAIQEQLTITQ
ncbi:hypothetical protein [Dongia deserti]|uniref:hypothetical protein n=1 Tax=Dongia deserti TaxID=2268030 RepID=UPI0013C438D1|nr:hypothetical protein [Dongia deserti]